MILSWCRTKCMVHFTIVHRLINSVLMIIIIHIATLRLPYHLHNASRHLRAEFAIFSLIFSGTQRWIRRRISLVSISCRGGHYSTETHGDKTNVMADWIESIFELYSFSFQLIFYRTCIMDYAGIQQHVHDRFFFLSFLDADWLLYVISWHLVVC